MGAFRKHDPRALSRGDKAATNAGFSLLIRCRSSKRSSGVSLNGCTQSKPGREDGRLFSGLILHDTFPQRAGIAVGVVSDAAVGVEDHCRRGTPTTREQPRLTRDS